MYHHQSLLLLFRAEMLPGVDRVTRMWIWLLSLHSEPSRKAEMRPPGPFWGMQRTGEWKTYLLLYNWRVMKWENKYKPLAYLFITLILHFLRCNKTTEVADGHSTVLFIFGFLGVILGSLLIIVATCYICLKCG